MRIGIDFDNTIANYDGVFYAAALELGLIPADLGRDKNSVRDLLNGSGRKDEFTKLQGYIYGARMDLVSPYPGVAAFVRDAVAAGHELFVVSHKTRTPMMGPPYDMHAAARGFLEAQGFFSPGMLSPENAFFELTKEEKVARAATLEVEAFIDDLPEILRMSGFPSTVRRILFDPYDALAVKTDDLERCTDWETIYGTLLGGPMNAVFLPRSQSQDNTDLLAEASRLCVKAGRGEPHGLKQLSGGKNNRVFRLDTDKGPLVLKSYFRHADDPRDRLGAEWNFLTYAWGRGVRCVPEPLACDRHAQLGLYDFVEGEKLSANGITEQHIEAAADFISTVNQRPYGPQSLNSGSEACFSVADHLDRVDQRVARLTTLDPEAPHVGAARTLVTERLEPQWLRVKASILESCTAVGVDPTARLPEADIIVSPSDFGFHNALWQDARGLTFLDFEYAGWDDPAKLAGDFFACPEIPTPPEHFTLFVETLCHRLNLGEVAQARMVMLRDAYYIKWACIVLNDFLSHHDARRRFANQGDRAARCAAQLDKADALIAKTVSDTPGG
ncbi:phosphotransferase [Rhodospirillum sp. A1_3_36]|uniref:phosphotransferase n=1 Tax=Rhodospirillum sp. A1_3_36 TaxID=3391666 RepID=UPI0039A71A10